MTVSVNIRGDDLADLMRRKPFELQRETDRAAGRGALEIAREMRANAPKADSTLTSSITTQRVAPGIHRVIVGSAYGRFVEEGTDGGGLPPQRAIEDWISVRGIEPDDPDMTREDLAFVIARSIAAHGTPAQPFFEPAWDAKAGRAQALLDDAVDRVMRL